MEELTLEELQAEKKITQYRLQTLRESILAEERDLMEKIEKIGERIRVFQSPGELSENAKKALEGFKITQQQYRKPMY